MSASAGQLTILLTLKDRVPFTHRWLDYAVDAALPFRILIADGGSDPGVPEAVAARQARGLDVEYLRYPVDETYADYYAKVADALSKVITPFVVLADNDDLFIPDGLTRAVQFLADHPDYVACGGQCAVFWLASGQPAAQDPVYGDSVEWKCSSQMHSDLADTAGQRILDQSMGASDVFYAVHRTALLRRQFETIRDFNPHDLFLMEQLVAFLTAISGKCRQLDLLYIARQQDSPGSSGGDHQERFGGWFDRMLLPTWSADFTRFVALSTDALARADGIPADRARQLIITAYKMSVAPSLLSDLLDEPTVTASMPLVLQVVRRLVRLPRTSVVRRLAQRVYRRTRWVSHDLVHGTEFRTARALGASTAFAPIRAFLTGPGRHHSSTRGT
jgi:glycosyltransferase domain-containing protein